MEKGVSKYWTPEAEERYKRLLAGCRDYAVRELTTNLRDLFKYDGRTRAAKRARAQANLRMATATDEELKQLAKLEVELMGENYIGTVLERFEELKKRRADIRKRGIKRSELECR